MSKLADLIATIEATKPTSLVKKIIVEYEVTIVDMNRAQLYEKGVNAIGVEISSYRPYTPFTVSIKTSKGQPTDRVTLKDTGAFHNSLVVEFNSDSFSITSFDDVYAGLVEKYGNAILGLTDENKQILIDEIKIELLKKIKILWTT